MNDGDSSTTEEQDKEEGEEIMEDIFANNFEAVDVNR
jgi:hypothetical protein